MTDFASDFTSQNPGDHVAREKVVQEVWVTPHPNPFLDRLHYEAHYRGLVTVRRKVGLNALLIERQRKG